MNKNKKTYLIFLIGFIIGVLGFTGSFLMYLKPSEIDKKDDIVGDKKEVVIEGSIVFSTIDNSIQLENIIPTLDKFGVTEKGFSFAIKNNSSEKKQYQLKLIDNNSTIKNNNIRYQLIKNGEVLGIYTLLEDGILEKSIIDSNEEFNYTIKLWLDYNSEVKAGRFSKKIAIDEIEEHNISDIKKPLLTDGMIPVYYDNSTNSWHKADENNIDNKWYNYDERKWANVVTVDKEKRNYYQDSSIGTKIAMDDVNSMWVWIPRFSYENNSVNFVNINTSAYQAFSFNNQELNGFWFSKFEASMKEDSECISLSLTSKCNDSNNILYFVPNYPFATKITMANLFYAIRKMELKNNLYGFNGIGNKLKNDGTIKGDNNDFDIHMIKNSEWQAVVLLSSSKYGNIDKAINNNSLFTGKVLLENEEFNYNVTDKGERLSTTGNITGIYDMFGGKREYVMISNSDLNIFNKKSNSGFTTNIKEYYYDNGFNDNDTTILLSEKISKDNLINNEPVTRGGYKNIGNIYNLYGANDYINKISVETNSRASLVILKGE